MSVWNDWAPVEGSAIGYQGQKADITLENESGETVTIPRQVWARGGSLMTDGSDNSPEDIQRAEDYIYMSQNRGGQQQAPITDDVKDRFLTEDERRSEFAQAVHPTSLMMSNPMSAFMYDEQGQMGGPETWFQNLGRMDTGMMSDAAPSTDYLNQFMGIPFASGLPGATPDNRMPVNPAMAPGSMEQPAPNSPGSYQPYAGHTANEMPSYNAGLMDTTTGRKMPPTTKGLMGT